MADKLITATQLGNAVNGFASAVASANYEQKANLKALAYKDDVDVDVMTTELKSLLDGKMTQTKAQEMVNQKVGKAYKPGGNKTLLTLPSLEAKNFGYVYHMTEDFTTTDDFIEGPGKIYTAGTEVAIVEVPGATENDPVTYKYNVLSNYIDTSKFASQSSFSIIKDAIEKIKIANDNDIQDLIDGLSINDPINIPFTLPVSEGDPLNVKIKWIGNEPDTPVVPVTIVDSNGGQINVPEVGPGVQWEQTITVDDKTPYVVVDVEEPDGYIATSEYEDKTITAIYKQNRETELTGKITNLLGFTQLNGHDNYILEPDFTDADYEKFYNIRGPLGFRRLMVYDTEGNLVTDSGYTRFNSYTESFTNGDINIHKPVGGEYAGKYILCFYPSMYSGAQNIKVGDTIKVYY